MNQDGQRKKLGKKCHASIPHFIMYLEHLVQHPVGGLELMAGRLVLEKAHQVGPLHTGRPRPGEQVLENILHNIRVKILK
jgi:hypothetical protein